MSTLLEATNISKNFGEFQALSDVSIQVPKHSIFGLLGPNGAGKTTLIRIINQITMPDVGHVILDGEPLKPEHVQYIGYLPEERGLYKSMKVGEHEAFAWGVRLEYFNIMASEGDDTNVITPTLTYLIENER